jgi:hypothetical protein
MPTTEAPIRLLFLRAGVHELDNTSLPHRETPRLLRTQNRLKQNTAMFGINAACYVRCVICT